MRRAWRTAKISVFSVRMVRPAPGYKHFGNSIMWFKNLQLYRLPTPWNVDLAKLEEQLARGPFVK